MRKEVIWLQSERVVDLSILVINEGSTSHSMTGASWYLIMERKGAVCVKYLLVTYN